MLVALVDETAVSTAVTPPPPPPPAILISRVWPVTLNVLPAPMKLSVLIPTFFATSRLAD